MTLDDLTKAITAASLFPIHVSGGIEEGDSTGVKLIGGLDAFIEAAQALGHRCVFVDATEVGVFHTSSRGGHSRCP